MYSRKLIVLVLVCLVSFVTFADLGDLSLYTSVTGAGATAGGLRVDLGNGFVADGTVAVLDDGSGDSATETQFFADVYYGVWGLAISGGEDIKASYSLMYAIEQAINDKITLGIGVALVTLNSDEDVATQFVNNYDIYAVLSL